MHPLRTETETALALFFQRELRKGLIAVYLFGSRRLGLEHRESDADVAVLLDPQHFSNLQDRFEERLQLSTALISVLHLNDVDVLILNDAPPTLAASIVTEGRRVFCADAHQDRAFFRDAQLRAADLAPFIRRTRRVKLEAIQR
jgi:predicted nucleotidyltransferase